MKIVYCSDFLVRQEHNYFAAAAYLTEEAYRQPSLWQRVWTAFFGNSHRMRHADAKRRQRTLAEAHYAATEGEYWARGRAGEDHFANVLAQKLDDRFLLLRNYTPPWPFSRGGDIDAVLLGPHGVTVFEVKAWRGNYRYERGNWWYQSSPQASWEQALGNPSWQAKENVRRVRAVLDREGIRNVGTQPVVAIAHPDMRVEFVPPVDVYLFFATDAHPRVWDLVNARAAAAWLPEQVLRSMYQAMLRGMPVPMDALR